jgi:putative ABC transport system permease protein
VTRHLLKLVWKRKRSNALLTLEIFFSFLVVFVVATMVAAMVARWRKPLGFDYSNVWVARIAFPPMAQIDDSDPALHHALSALVREARSLPEVEWAAAGSTPPYGNATWTSQLTVDNRHIDVTRDTVSDDYLKVMRLPLLRGRWFGPEDEAANTPPLVLDADAARALFGTIEVVGKTVQSGPEQRFTVVGVVAPYRMDGELSADSINMVFGRLSLLAEQGQISRNIELRLRPGTPAEFEQTLIRRLHGAAPDYPVRIQHMDLQRKLMNKIHFAPAVIGGIVATFLIVMVALGLSGVLWQNVTRRTREIGLRRALGATGPSVNRQILTEVALLSTLAVILGLVIVAQLPILGVFRLVAPPAYVAGIAGALATIYGLTLLCGLYPSWLAGRVQPAQALHYE